MPRGDGTGPMGQGAGSGIGRGGRGQGRGGNCVCPNCGEKIAHAPGSPCYEQQCPKCGAAMTRE